MNETVIRKNMLHCLKKTINFEEWFEMMSLFNVTDQKSFTKRWNNFYVEENYKLINWRSCLFYNRVLILLLIFSIILIS